MSEQTQSGPAPPPEKHIARVLGEPFTALPQDLYIPPDALEVFLDQFEGPLDLLLYLIKRQNIEIVDIPVAEITRQYMTYIELMQELKLELAAEYLVMAAMLTEIKSRSLLPRPIEENEEDDPRAELIRRLQEYERFKQAAEGLNTLPRIERELFLVKAAPPVSNRPKPAPEVDLTDLLFAFKEVLQRAALFSHHHIQREPLSVRERMSMVLSRLGEEGFTEFTRLFNVREGRPGVVVTLLAVLELIKERLIELVQAEPFAPIHLKPAGRVEEVVET